jgi:hypothetical protein
MLSATIVLPDAMGTVAIASGQLLVQGKLVF